MTEKGFELISESNFKVFLTNRHGGYSLPPFATFNLGTHVGDSQELVTKNRIRLADLIKLDNSQTIYMNQVHGSEVMVVNHPTNLPLTCDAMVTNKPNLALIVLVADCVPIVFVDDVNNAIGVAHAGWRGTAERIAIKTAQTMTKEFGTKPEYLKVFIGPSIGACCYEVGGEVVKKIEESITPSSKCSKQVGDNFYLNLKEANHQQLLMLGVKNEMVSCIHECTSCNIEKLYSHRKENGQTGRFGMGVYMLP